MFKALIFMTAMSLLALGAHAQDSIERDAQRFPHMMSFLKGMKVEKSEPVSAGNEGLIHTNNVCSTSPELWDAFFKAAAADHLTILRALALIAREFRNRNLTVFGPGSGFEQAVAKNNLDLGLAVPARLIGLGIWEPDATIKDPEFLLHLTIVYKEKFLHQLPNEVLPVSIKIGTGDETDYYVERQKHHGYLLTADLYYGAHGIGFRNVHGVGAEKHGLAGLVQKVLFFLPDSIHSMLIDEEHNVMVTEALINTTVENFETREVYQIRYRGERGASNRMGDLDLRPRQI